MPLHWAIGTWLKFSAENAFANGSGQPVVKVNRSTAAGAGLYRLYLSYNFLETAFAAL